MGKVYEIENYTGGTMCGIRVDDKGDVIEIYGDIEHHDNDEDYLFNSKDMLHRLQFKHTVWEEIPKDKHNKTKNHRNMYENIAEIAFQWGQMFEKEEVDFPSCSYKMHDQVIELAEEFEESWEKAGIDADYITMIDNFIYKKLKNPVDIDIKQLLKDSDVNINYGIEEDLLEYFIYGRGSYFLYDKNIPDGRVFEEVFDFVDTLDYEKYIKDIGKLSELEDYINDADEALDIGLINFADRLVVEYCFSLIIEIMGMLDIKML